MVNPYIELENTLKKKIEENSIKPNEKEIVNKSETTNNWPTQTKYTTTI